MMTHSTSPAPEFDPCPFCGHSNVSLQSKPTRRDPNLMIRFAKCDDCGTTSKPLIDHVDGDPNTIKAKILRRWNSRPRVASNEELRTVIRDVEVLIAEIIEAKNKKTLTATQKAAIETIQEKLDGIMPAARRANKFVPIPFIRLA